MLLKKQEEKLFFFLSSFSPFSPHFPLSLLIFPFLSSFSPFSPHFPLSLLIFPFLSSFSPFSPHFPLSLLIFPFLSSFSPFSPHFPFLSLSLPFSPFPSPSLPSPPLPSPPPVHRLILKLVATLLVWATLLRVVFLSFVYLLPLLPESLTSERVRWPISVRAKHYGTTKQKLSLQKFLKKLQNITNISGALREPMESNRSFPMMSTLRIDFAPFEIFPHMLDFKSSMSCLGLG